MKYLLPWNELELKFTIPDFVIKTQQQIAKDFHNSGQEIPTSFLDTEHSLDEIVDEIILNLEQISRTGERQLLQLLYQIDIPQQDFLSLVQDTDLYTKLALMIVQREAYKVYLRSKF